MKRILIITLMIAAVAAIISCSEEIDLNREGHDTKFLSVECILTDIPLMSQVVKLSESVDYFGKDSINLVAPPVLGAKVTVTDGTDTVQFKEKTSGDKGSYYAPTGFYAKAGKTYHLHIEINDPEEGVKEYNSTSTMIESGCRLDAVDYKMIDPVDSLYAISIWGEVFDQDSYLLALPFINTTIFPLDGAFGLENKYYKGQYLSAFPISAHLARWRTYELGRPCNKPFEVGDIVGIGVLSLTKEFYDYFMAFFYSDSAGSIPLITSQPANMPTNIEGENVVGFFTTAPVQLKYTVVDDPARMEYNVTDPRPQ